MDAFVGKNAAGERVLKFVTPEESQETTTSHSYVNTQPKFDKAKVQVGDAISTYLYNFGS